MTRQKQPKKKIKQRLTTVSLDGSWLPRGSRGFHFWQSARRLNDAPIACTMAQPSHGPPQKMKQNTGTCDVTLKQKISMKKEQQGGEGLRVTEKLAERHLVAGKR